MSNVTEFILLGLTQDPGLQTLLFAVLLIIYLLTLAGNLLISVTVFTSPALGSPICAYHLPTGTVKQTVSKKAVIEYLLYTTFWRKRQNR